MATASLSLILVLSGAASKGGSTARADDLPPLRSEHPPFFTADVAISTDAEGHEGLSVAVSIPYSDLEWIKVPHGLGAGVEVLVAFEPGGLKRVYGDVWERRVVVPTFGSTISPNAAVVVNGSFQVPSGQYLARVTVRDLNSHPLSVAPQ